MGYLKEKIKNNSAYFQPPSKYLKNVIVDINKTSKVNEPAYVKNKRKRGTILTDSDSENSDVISDYLSSDNEETNISNPTIASEKNQSKENLILKVTLKTLRKKIRRKMIKETL